MLIIINYTYNNKPLLLLLYVLTVLYYIIILIYIIQLIQQYINTIYVYYY
jgi:hypothetical protein